MEEIKKDDKFDYNLPINEFYMETINVQKKKELEIKYKKKIKDYRNTIFTLFIMFIVLTILLIIIILFSKIIYYKTIKENKQIKIL